MLSRQKERTDLSVRERIVLHIYGSLRRSGGKAEVHILSQTGIADALNITRAHAAIELERGSGNELFCTQKEKTENSRRVKIYLLTPKGIELARKLSEKLESARVVEESIENPSKHSPARVLKELDDAELAMLCALRLGGPLESGLMRQKKKIPFVVRNGAKLELSDAAADAVDRLLADERRRKMAFSLLSDYYLEAGDHPKRLKYLVESGRISEAARLVSYHSEELQATGPEDIAGPVSALEGWLESPPDELLMLSARVLLELQRPDDALERLGRIGARTNEHRLIVKLAEAESAGRPAGMDERRMFSDSAKSDREISMYHRLCAWSVFLSNDLETAEREATRAVRVSTRAGDVSESRLNYRLLARIERERGDFSEAARVESKLRSVERLHGRKSD